MGVYPPPKIPLVAFERSNGALNALLRLSPKSTAFPVDEITTVSTSFVKLGADASLPPPKTPLTLDEKAPALLFPSDKVPKSTEFPVEEKLI